MDESLDLRGKKKEKEARAISLTRLDEIADKSSGRRRKGTNDEGSPGWYVASLMSLMLSGRRDG